MTQIVESPFFRDYGCALYRKAETMHRKKLLRELRVIRDELEALLALLLAEQHVALTTDSWTGVANRTFTGYTCTFINDDWKLVAFSPFCSVALRGSSMFSASSH